MFFLGRRDFLWVAFFLVSLEGFFMPLLCARALFFLCWARPLPLDAVTRLLDFLVFLFFIDFCTGMWGSSLRMVSFGSDRALSRSAATGGTSCMLCWGVWDFRGIMYAFRRFRIPPPFWVFLRMTGMKFSPSPVWKNCSHNEGFEM